MVVLPIPTLPCLRVGLPRFRLARFLGETVPMLAYSSIAFYVSAARLPCTSCTPHQCALRARLQVQRQAVRLPRHDAGSETGVVLKMIAVGHVVCPVEELPL